ncbi:MAG: hypothetical protein H0X41_07495 [Chitinophagaceae bacterium]|nr:hypothetical protein [Chitinophagaceae bacterium]
MVSSLREAFNDSFTEKNYQAFLSALHSRYPGAIEFRIAETPVFIPKDFGDKMFNACESIIDLICEPGFMALTDASIPSADKVPGSYGFPQTIAFDFGICENKSGELEPQLVEMQGFPSLYGFQVYYPDLLREYFRIPSNYSQYLGGLDRLGFITLFNDVILAGHNPENVVLLEIKPNEQKTRVDFYCTKDITGINTVCLTEIIQEGRALFYMHNGIKIKIERIYNRVIFDELHSRKDLGNIIDIRQDFDVTWVPHPDWFYRISKYTLPFIHHPCVPETFFLNEVKQRPADLENYVLKPLFSFAGQGVIIDLTDKDIDDVKDPENWILQRKVKYADVIRTPADPAKAEIRIMYLWKDGERRPMAAINLARLSKGKMIGVRYNKDKEWVGGSVAYFER